MQIFRIVGEICDSTVDDFYKFISGLKDDTAYMFIHTTGGDIDATYALQSIMEHGNIKWVTYCGSIAYSAGLHLVAHGDIRWGSRRSNYMYHDRLQSFEGNPNSIVDELNQTKKWLDGLDKDFAKKTKKELTWWKGQLSRASGEYYFGVRKAKQLGVIDHIGCPL